MHDLSSFRTVEDKAVGRFLSLFLSFTRSLTFESVAIQAVYAHFSYVAVSDSLRNSSHKSILTESLAVQRQFRPRKFSI